MPHTVTHDVAVQDLRKGDLVNGRGIVDTVKRGTKWVEVRDGVGSLLMRKEVDQPVLVSRVEPTEEEKAAKLREYEVEHRTRQLHDGLKNTPHAYLTEHLASTPADAYLAMDYWVQQTFVKMQAKYRVYRDIEAILARLVEKNEGDILKAFELGTEINDRYLGDPTSRSTSVLSNLNDELYVWAKAEVRRNYFG